MRAALAAEAAALDLIDEYRARVYPVLVGGGIPFFPQRERRVDLELTEPAPSTRKWFTSATAWSAGADRSARPAVSRGDRRRGQASWRRREKVRWITPLGEVAASMWKRCSSPSSPSQSRSPRPSPLDQPGSGMAERCFQPLILTDAEAVKPAGLGSRAASGPDGAVPLDPISRSARRTRGGPRPSMTKALGRFVVSPGLLCRDDRI